MNFCPPALHLYKYIRKEIGSVCTINRLISELNYFMASLYFYFTLFFSSNWCKSQQLTNDCPKCMQNTPSIKNMFTFIILSCTAGDTKLGCCSFNDGSLPGSPIGKWSFSAGSQMYWDKAHKFLPSWEENFSFGMVKSSPRLSLWATCISPRSWWEACPEGCWKWLRWRVPVSNIGTDVYLSK